MGDTLYKGVIIMKLSTNIHKRYNISKICLKDCLILEKEFKEPVQWGKKVDTGHMAQNSYGSIFHMEQISIRAMAKNCVFIFDSKKLYPIFWLENCPPFFVRNFIFMDLELFKVLIF